MLASPFVGVSNDALVLLRRRAGGGRCSRASSAALPEALDERDVQLFRAFRQRYERLAAARQRALARAPVRADRRRARLRPRRARAGDGRRRYANMRKLARLARSYEELRGRDIEGFVRFVREQDAVGATRARGGRRGGGRRRGPPAHDPRGQGARVQGRRRRRRRARPRALARRGPLPAGRPLRLQGRHPSTGKRLRRLRLRRGAEAEAEAERGERRRLYYVAMTRAIDRLIVVRLDRRRARRGPETPIGWVLERLEPGELERAGDAPVEIERDGARFLAARRPLRGREPRRRSREPIDEEGAAVAVRRRRGRRPRSRFRRCPSSSRCRRRPSTACGALVLQRARALRALLVPFLRRAVAGMRAAARRTREGEPALAATEVGDAVHGLLERIDLAAPGAPDDSSRVVRADIPSRPMRSWSASAALVDGVLRVGARAPASPTLDGAKAGAAVRVRARRSALPRPHRRAAPRRRVAPSSSTTRRTRSASARRRTSSKRSTTCSGSSTQSCASRRRRRSRGRATSSWNGPDDVVSTLFTRADLPGLEAELSAAIARIQAGDFRPNPGEMVCSDCPVLGLVCAGPALRSYTSGPAPR